MFTGIIKEVGLVSAVKTNSEGKEFVIASKQLISDIAVDDSIAINGTCLTATQVTSSTFTIQAVHITLEKTTLGHLQVGSKVNMELALKVSDRLGGHFVQGHVNGKTQILNIQAIGDNYLYTLALPNDLRKYIIKEGSIALDGISLTVADLDETSLTVSLIPHTILQTNLKDKKVGDEINMEVDILAKYIENFLIAGEKNNSPLTKEWLQQQGY